MTTRSRSLPSLPESPAAARALVRRVIYESGIAVDVENALLVVSELVSNVVRHAHTPMRVDVETEPALRVAVTDRRPDLALPPSRSSDRLATRGRGLHLLDALATRWGETRATGAKTVWFEMDPARFRGAAK